MMELTNGGPPLQGRARPNGKGKATDIRVAGVELYLLPVTTRMPLQFGGETLREVTCARARVVVAGRDGRLADGWGETPLNVEWAWPGAAKYADRSAAMLAFCECVAAGLAGFDAWGHPLEIGVDFQRDALPALIEDFNAASATTALPLLAALVCTSPFDLALHDAFGRLHGLPTYEAYHQGFLTRDLATLFASSGPTAHDFRGLFPADFLAAAPPRRLLAWHMVGGLDPLHAADLTGREPADGYPVLLADWIARDGLRRLKVKLRGVDAEWDYQRLVRVGRLGLDFSVERLSADFNCSVERPEYVNAVLDRLAEEQPDLFAALDYVEQPFSCDLARDRLNVSSVAARKPLLMDESAHTWEHIELGRSLGWSGVALKTCKTQTGAILGLCWAKAHRMHVMVQDLTNPMLAQIPHVLLAAHANTGMGVETNAMQFYPDASEAEARVHPGLYQRRRGEIDLSTLRGPGFGYRLEEIGRRLPEPVARFGQVDERRPRGEAAATTARAARA